MAARPQLSFGGVPLGLATPELQQWIDRWIPPDPVPEFAYHAWPGFRQSWITFPKATRPQPVRIGTLSWPQGASRWATGHFLCSADQADAIRKKCCQVNGSGDPTNSPETLLIDIQDQQGEQVGEKVSRLMYAQPPRPLSWNKRGRKPANNLYLITLVDERYFWQYKPTDDLSEAGSTWTDLIEYLCDALGLEAENFSIKSAIEDVFLAPACELLTGHSMNAALWLDAAAYNVGRRCVWKNSMETGEEVRLLELLNATENATRFATNKISQERKVISGGLWQFGARSNQRTLDNEAAIILPYDVRVTFPVCDDGVQTCGRYAVSKTCEPNGFGTLVFHDRVLAYGSDTPSNDSDLQDLVTRIKDDYTTYQEKANLDVTFAGPWSWEVEGISESVEWTVGFAERSMGDEDDASKENGAAQCQTRIFRSPWNQWPEELLHQNVTGAGSGSGTDDDCDTCGGINVSDLIRCTDAGTEVRDAKLVLCDGHLAIVDN